MDMEVRLLREREHASDSGQGGSDEDIQANLPPVINLVQRKSLSGIISHEKCVHVKFTLFFFYVSILVPCDLTSPDENPWQRAGGESLSKDDLLNLSAKIPAATGSAGLPPNPAIPDLVNISHCRLPAC